MRHLISLSLADLSPLNPPPENHLLVVLKSYFDGGNKVELGFDRISLAVVCGTAEQWKRFDTDWKKVRYRHSAPPLHTTDAVGLQNNFDVDKCWTNERVDAFIDSCVDVIERHIAIPSGVPRKRARMGLFPITLTIRFDEWLRARKDNPSIPNTIEESCATETLSFAFKWETLIGAQHYELYFDRGESFYGHVVNRFYHPQARIDVPLLQQVVHLGKSDSSSVPALQMADLFAWGINHANRERRLWHYRLHDLRWESRALNYEHLISPSPKALEMTARWKLPKRRSSESVLLPIAKS